MTDDIKPPSPEQLKAREKFCETYVHDLHFWFQSVQDEKYVYSCAFCGQMTRLSEEEAKKIA